MSTHLHLRLFKLKKPLRGLNKCEAVVNCSNETTDKAIRRCTTISEEALDHSDVFLNCS
jgi:hypothetical protein